jgi:hypothetical protein
VAGQVWETEAVSATSRNKGVRAEQQVCAALERLGIEAITSRNVQGGRQEGPDIIAPDLPVSIEVKDGTGSRSREKLTCGCVKPYRDRLPQWLDQARAQADWTAPGAVIHKRKGKANAEDWFVTMALSDFVDLVDRLTDPDFSEVPF